MKPHDPVIIQHNVIILITDYPLKGGNMTDIIYMKSIESCYEREFTSKVVRVNEEEEWIELERTLFYPEGGGQPSDFGSIKWEGGSSLVVHVKKKNRIMHFIEGDLPAVGDVIKGTLDWERRYSHMKMHTAQHLLSSVIWERYRASTVGNQIHSDRSHIDFHPASFSMEELKDVESAVNLLIEEGREVTLEDVPRKIIEEKIEKERVDLSRLPFSIKELRTVYIGDNGSVDMCPCAGTHVKNISELEKMTIIKRKSKGSGKIRIEYELG